MDEYVIRCIPELTKQFYVSMHELGYTGPSNATTIVYRPQYLPHPEALAIFKKMEALGAEYTINLMVVAGNETLCPGRG